MVNGRGIEQAVEQPRSGAKKAHHAGSGRSVPDDPQQQFHVGTVPADQPAIRAFVLLQGFARPDDVREGGGGGEAQVETLPGQRVDVTRRITDQGTRPAKRLRTRWRNGPAPMETSSPVAVASRS